MEMFKRGGKEGNGAEEQMSLYRRFLLNKYPQMTFKSYQQLS
jgi:hypothetical protein